jgi:2-polyprenyl-6-methoxyphenol hydroxylase-like FAD-dependent oxidoreductase
MLTEDLAPFLCPRHCDLHVWLIDLVKAQGVHIRYGTEVVHIDAQRPSVHLASGESWLGDIVVGADGYASRVREVVTGEELQFKSPRTVYRYIPLQVRQR